MKKAGFIIVFLAAALVSGAQSYDCTFKPPKVTIHFGRGNVTDPNIGELGYGRVSSSCPQDGHYSYASSTSGCFSDDWHTLSEDHTPGDVEGNMLLVNASPYRGVFMRMAIPGLKSNTVYELGLWLMNLCRPTEKCGYPLLPNLFIRLETPEGKVIANIVTGDVPRVPSPQWTQHRAYFTTPASISTLMLVMLDNAPGGCGNDFAMDDITFRECVPITKTPPPKPRPVTNPSTTRMAPKPQSKKPVANVPPKEVQTTVVKPKTDTISTTISVAKQIPKIFPPAPVVLKTRENALVRKIETEGEIKIELYDNGEIDGDTVSVYHNNTLIKSHMRLSQIPISFTIAVNSSQPHHEVVMVAENLGTIPPNTSMMIITTPNGRYEVFISSTEQKNAKVVFDLKK